MAHELDSEDSDVGEAGPNCDWKKYKVRSHASTGYQSNNKRDIIDTFFTYVNRDLLICKLFYFFFFAAFGSLFPLFAIYFKQLGMNPTQSGILIGFRPFVEFCSAPFWGGLADKFKKGKQLLLFSIVCWIVFTLSIAAVKPAPHHCHETNFSNYKIPAGYVVRGKRSIKYSFADDYYSKKSNQNKQPENVAYHIQDDSSTTPLNNKVLKNPLPQELAFHPLSSKSAKEGLSVITTSQGTKTPQLQSTTTMPHAKATVAVKDIDDNGEYVKPKYSTIYYKKKDIQDVFFSLLLLVVIGEFFSAPAITFVDSVTLAYLGEDTDNYGRQRMFGSLGWGFAMFFVGLALDQSTTFPDHPCDLQHRAEKNYIVCFAVFFVLMVFALITATQLKFDHRHGGGKDFQLIEYVEKVKDKAMEMITGKRPLDRTKLFRDNEDEDIDYLESKASMKKENGFDYDDPNAKSNGMISGDTVGQTNGTNGKNIQISLENRNDMVSDVTKKPISDSNVDDEEEPFLGKWMAVLRMLATFKYISVLFIAWFMGFGIGLIFTFLFWYLQDIGGSPTLFGVASVINHVSELLAYFLSRKIIARVGHIRVLYAGLFGNVVRFLYISWLRKPEWVLPFECVQGLTHAAVWAACCSYITQAIPTGLRSSAQGILQGLHHGLGRGCGAVFGGIMVYSFGCEVTFRVYGITCLILLILYAGLNFFLIDRGRFTYGSREQHSILEEEDNQCHLAPHGVPSGMARDLSSNKLRDEGVSNYGSTSYVPFTEASYQDPFNSAPQTILMNEPPNPRTEVYQQQPYNTVDQMYGP